jgi:hypothetical protein
MKKMGLAAASWAGWLMVAVFWGISLAGSAQGSASLQWQRVSIANSGCSVNLPAQAKQSELITDEDSNRIYKTLSEAVVQGVTYYFSVTTLQLADEEEADGSVESLEEFMAYVRSTQNIIDFDGPRPINHLLRGRLAKGLTDSWTDQAGNAYSVMGWIKGKTMAVLCVYGAKKYPASTQINTFFNSFQFPSGF